MSDIVDRIATVFAGFNLDGCELVSEGGNIRACVGPCRCRDAARAAYTEIGRELLASGFDLGFAAAGDGWSGECAPRNPFDYVSVKNEAVEAALSPSVSQA